MYIALAKLINPITINIALKPKNVTKNPPETAPNAIVK